MKKFKNLNNIYVGYGKTNGGIFGKRDRGYQNTNDGKDIRYTSKRQTIMVKLCEHREKNDESSSRERFLVEYIEELEKKFNFRR